MQGMQRRRLSLRMCKGQVCGPRKRQRRKAEITRADIEDREWTRVEAEAIVRYNSNAVDRLAIEARPGQVINQMLQGGWQWRLPPR